MPDSGGPVHNGGTGIWVGSCGTEEKRWLFERCPGWYLRKSVDGYDSCLTIDGTHTPFDKAWRAHWRYSSGHSIGNPPPPKLLQAIELIESERRAKEVLQIQASSEKQKRTNLRSKHPNAKIIASG